MNPFFAYFGLPGPVELLIVAGIVLLLFGNRLPSVMRSMGRGIVEFKKGVQGIEDQSDADAAKVTTDAAQTVAEDTVHSASVDSNRT
ncbi:MAG: twin-arginine translocase TatA/TatE family subunit [Planctomycetota bacterium]|nr:twin-arginine translocase TatA/TatE family subunit [Planctomycetota bacterium]